MFPSMHSCSFLPPFLPFLPLHPAGSIKPLFLACPLQFDTTNGPFRMLLGTPTDPAIFSRYSCRSVELMKAANLKAVGVPAEERLLVSLGGSSQAQMGAVCNSSRSSTMEGIQYCKTSDELARTTDHRVIGFVNGGEGTPDMQVYGLLDGEKDSASANDGSINRSSKKNVQTVADFNKFLIEMMRHGKLDTPVHLFSEFQSRGLPPDALTFSVMIRCFCKRNEPDNARILLDDMLTNGFLPSILTFTILIDCYCKRGRVQKAIDVLELMEKMECEPATRTYNCLLNGLCLVGRVEEASQLLMKMKYPSAKADIYSFTTVMDGFCKVGRTDEALELLNDALKMGLQPTVVTCNALLNGYCKEGRPADGLVFLTAMEERRCQPDIVSYNTLLQGLLRWGETNEALKIYKKMVQLGFQVDERVMNTLLRGVCRKSVAGKEQLKEVEGLIGFLNEMSYTISPYTYCLVVQALAQGGEISKALNNMLDMVNKGYFPRIMTYNIILRVLCREGRTDDAMLVFVVMMKLGTTPSTFSCTILIDELNQQKRFLDACGVYALALKRGVVAKRKPKRKSM